MDTLLTEDETAIQQAAAEFFSTEATPLLVRAAERGEERMSRELWAKVAELGWLGISLPESCGGQAALVGFSCAATEGSALATLEGARRVGHCGRASAGTFFDNHFASLLRQKDDKPTGVALTRPADPSASSVRRLVCKLVCT